METLMCAKCDGRGESHSDYANYNASTGQFSPGWKRCHYCDGRGSFPALDAAAVLAAVHTTRGARRLRASMTSPVGRGLANVAAVRAYYVWRLARFHGGADVTMPMMANLLIEGDPALPDLERLAAYTWGRALGHFG